MAGYITINGAVTSLPAGAEAIGPLTIVATGTVGQTTDIIGSLHKMTGGRT